MGLAPVIGLASTVVGYSQQKQQQRAAEAGANAQAQAAQADAAIKRSQLVAQQGFADYQANVNSLQRDLQRIQHNTGNQAQGIMSEMQYQQQVGEATAQRAIQQAQILDQRGQVSAQKAQSTIGRDQAVGQASAETGTFLDQLTASLKETGTGQLAGERTLAQLQTAQAASGTTSDSRSSDVAQSQGIKEILSKVYGDAYTSLNQADQADVQLQFATQIANLQNNLQQSGLSESDRRLQFADTQGGTALQNIITNAGQTRLMNQQAQAADSALFDQAQSSSEWTDRVNQLYAQQGLAMQGNAVNSTLGSQMSQINTQRAQIAASAPSPLGLVSAFAQTVPSLFPGGGGQRATQSPYSIANGVRVTPFSLGQQQPTGNFSRLDPNNSPFISDDIGKFYG